MWKQEFCPLTVTLHPFLNYTQPKITSTLSHILKYYVLQCGYIVFIN